jgi:hypothetical protein
MLLLNFLSIFAQIPGGAGRLKQRKKPFPVSLEKRPVKAAERNMRLTVLMSNIISPNEKT